MSVTSIITSLFLFLSASAASATVCGKWVESINVGYDDLTDQDGHPLVGVATVCYRDTLFFSVDDGLAFTIGREGPFSGDGQATSEGPFGLLDASGRPLAYCIDNATGAPFSHSPPCPSGSTGPRPHTGGPVIKAPPHEPGSL